MSKTESRVGITGLAWEMPGLTSNGLPRAQGRASTWRGGHAFEQVLRDEFPEAKFVMFEPGSIPKAHGLPSWMGPGMALLSAVAERAVAEDREWFGGGGRTGTYVAAGLYESGRDQDGDADEASWRLMRSLEDQVACRLGSWLGCTGPVGAHHSMCSSTMLALAAAHADLQSGRVERALLVSGFLCGSALARLSLLRNGMASASGRHRSFSLDKDGFLPAEGAVALTLRCIDAADEERTLGAVAGVANGFCARPGRWIASKYEADAFVSVVDMALAQAGIAFGDLTLLEGHGAAAGSEEVEIAAWQKLRDRAYARGPGLATTRPAFGYSIEASGGFALLGVLGRLSGQWLAIRDERVSDTFGAMHDLGRPMGQVRHGLTWSVGMFGTCGASVVEWAEWMRRPRLPVLLDALEVVA